MKVTTCLHTKRRGINKAHIKSYLRVGQKILCHLVIRNYTNVNFNIKISNEIVAKILKLDDYVKKLIFTAAYQTLIGLVMKM